MVRNLLYYVYPRQSSMLAYNLYLLCKYHKIFNGRKIIYASEEEGLVDKLHLGWMFDDTHRIAPFELITVPHYAGCMQTCFSRMLTEVASGNPEEISFFAHAKGTDSTEEVAKLSEMVEPMYHNNLGVSDEIDAALSVSPCGGTFKYRNIGGWGYAGSFFWLNHQKFFTPGWSTMLEVSNNIDEYLCKKFSYGQAHNFGGDVFLEVHNDPEKYEALCNIDRNWDASKVSIVTTCKNRWEFLRQSLATWLHRGFKQIIIVDWDSEVEVASHFSKFPMGSNRVSVLRVDGEKIFNAGMARNAGARLASSEYILFIDSDMVIKDWTQTTGISLSPGRFYHGPHNIPPFGTSLVRKKDFDRVNGYSELYPAYGWEDNDLYNRLEESGIQRRLYDERLVEHLDHDDALRAQHRDQQGKQLHETVWSNRTIEKWTTEHKHAKKQYKKKEFWI